MQEQSPNCQRQKYIYWTEENKKKSHLASRKAYYNYLLLELPNIITIIVYCLNK